MGRTSPVTILVFVAGLGIGYFARSAGICRPHRTETRAADLTAIEKLHKAEVGYTEATYKMSIKDNPVNFPRTPGMRVLKRQGDGSWKFALVGLK